MNNLLFRFAGCNHVGRLIKARTATAFIRYAEIRTYLVVEDSGNCPDCNRLSGADG